MRANSDGGAIRCGAEAVHCGRGVIHRVQGFGGRIFRMMPVDEFGIAFGDMRRVPKHRRAKIDGGRRGVDRAAKAVLDQKRQTPAVIDMGMRQHHCLDGLCIYREIAVQSLGFAAAPLKHAAIQQVKPALHFKLVQGSCDALGGAVKRNLHEKSAQQEDRGTADQIGQHAHLV